MYIICRQVKRVATYNSFQFIWNYSKKFSNVFAGYHISLNILPKKEQAYYYTYSLRMRWILCLEVVVKSVPLLRSRCKNSPLGLCMLQVYDDLHLVLQPHTRPHILGLPPPMVFYLTQSLWATLLLWDFLGPCCGLPDHP